MLPVEDCEKTVPKLISVIKTGAASNLKDVFMRSLPEGIELSDQIQLVHTG
jgi:hypothetical protein